MSIYLLLDTTHVNYYHIIKQLYAHGSHMFIPLLNEDGSRALAQVKDNYPRPDWMFFKRAGIIDILDKAGASTEVGKLGWINTAGKPTIIDNQEHKDFFEGSLTEAEYKTALTGSKR